MSKNMLKKIAAVFISVVMMICIIPTDILALGVESESTSLISTGNVLSEEGSEPSNDGEQETVIAEDPGINENETISAEPENYNAEVVDENSYEAVTLGVNTITDLDKLVNIASQIADTTVTVDSNKQIKVNANGLILLSNVDYDFTGYTVYLITLSGGDADLTQVITDNTTTYSYQGLGTDSNPFSGTLEAQDGSYGAILNVPFFKNVDAEKITFTNFTTLKLKQKGDSGALSAMLAANVSGTSGEAWKSLNIEVGKESVTDGGTTTDYLPTALIDTMAENASLSLGTITYTDGATVSAANAGLLCNTMNENSSLEVSTLTVNGTVSITATSGDAGGFVGLMNVGASLSVNADADTAVTIGSNFTITGQNAGGLIGSGENIKLNGTKAVIDKATVNGNFAVGGLIGSYTVGGAEGSFASYDGLESSIVKVNNVALETTANDKYAGGLFGVLDLKSNFAITNASVVSIISGSKAYYGGFVGQVKGDSSDSLRDLTISGTSNPSTDTSVNLNGYAGAVAVIGDTSSPVYVQVSGIFSPSFSGVDKSGCFGGVAAYIKPASVLELNATFTPSGCTNIPKGGGVLGNAERGSTLCLDGTTNLSSTQFNSTNVSNANVANTMGQIVGTQESALIYAKSDWKFIRQSTAQALDDIGTYGEVIRLGGNMGMGTPSVNIGLSANLIFQNATTHKTEFLDSAKNDLSGDTFTVTSADQLALIAIEEQTKCAFNILGTSSTDYYFKSNPSKNITLGANISLEQTGIIGLQRDIDVGYAYTGTLDGQNHNGQNHTLTIAAGEIYGYRGTEGTVATAGKAGSGQIHGHAQVGFFSQANATVNNLTVNGGINLYFRTKTTDTSTTYLAGGLVAKNTKTSSYTNVSTFVNMQYQGTANGTIGGLVGLGTALTISSCTGSAEINAGSSAVYAGGLIGQYTGTSDLTVNNTTLSGTMTATGANHARLGGLVSRIAKGNYDEVTVTLTNITVDGQTIAGTGIKGSNVNNVPVPASCGGLLGYEWNNASVIFGDKSTHSNGLTVTGSSSVTVAGTTETGGLVYAATGYWQVNDIKLQNLSVTSDDGDLGLLICRGWRKDIPTDSSKTTKPYLLYLEETANNAYQIGTVSVTNTGGCFDEWVVYTCKSKETIMNNGNSVISIATEAGILVENQRVGVDSSTDNCTSYQNRTEYGKTTTENPNARYYYDLDVIREKATKNGMLDTPGELVLWAVWRYSEEKTVTNKSNIQDYFLIADKTYDIYGTEIDGNNTLIDLTGYAYYPISIDGYPLEVKNITIKFANQIIETAEEKTGENLDSLIRTTIGTKERHTQHYLLHSGLLLNYQNSSSGDDVTMTVSNVTFQGTIGKGPDGGSGVLICGQLGGYTNATSPKYAHLTISGVTLSGVSVNANKTSADSDYSPLLVNRVGSYSSLSAQNVSTSNYSNDTSADNPVATSLIGHVGSENAMNITLAFLDGINLSGRKNDSIFSHATLLESFRYQSGGSGYYRFYQDDTSYTYGREISESVENKDLQLWYSQKNPDDTLVEVKDGVNTDFNDYLPYVCRSYTDGTDKYHELEVNLASPDLTEGCGTYDDPYIISSPGQLIRAADFINGNTPQTGWKVNKVTNSDSIKTGENVNHSEYEVGKSGWDDAGMRNYMRGAYYQIKKDLSGDLTLKSFAGFGSVNNPFVGVFDGNGKTIIIENAGSGFINVSYGSVVQNLTIQYTGSKTLTGSLPEDSDNKHEVYADTYFGGIIGTVQGGDSMINDVTVKFNPEFTITTSNKLNGLQCAGGFVGLIQGGGVVFRNMGTVTQNPGYTKTSDKYYVDKYIGRVLDGYAINEVSGSGTDASVTFEGKNYSIPNISSGTSIAWNGGNISISNAQQMMIFSNIINSGTASGGCAPAYDPEKARTRNAVYSKIDNISDAADTAFTASRKDDRTLGTENLPYLINKYAENNSGFWTACTSANGIFITFAQNASIDLSPYGNGYRGIGGRYHCNANGGTLTNNTPKINTVTGIGVSIHLENDIKEYRADNFYANAVGGLFNVLRHEGATIDNVNVYGTVKVSSDFGTTNDVEADYLKRAPVGGVIGRDYSVGSQDTDVKILSLNTVSFGKADVESIVYGECVTGGLIGSSGTKGYIVFDDATRNVSLLKLADCSYQKVAITGGICTGGFIGSVLRNSAHFAFFDERNTPVDTLHISWADADITIGSNSKIRNLISMSGGTTANGVGGVIGFSSIYFDIQGVSTSGTSFNEIQIFGGDANKRGRVGGLVGFMVNNNLACAIKYINLTRVNVGFYANSSYDDNAGGIVGTWYATGTLTISDCVVKDATIQGNSAGGIIGYDGRGGKIFLKNITVSNVNMNKVYGSYVGGIGGQILMDFFGQNILLKDMTYSVPNNSGRFFGTGTNARLLGVTIQQQNDKTLPAKDIYNRTYPTDYGSTNYVVYAGYNSSGTITTASDISIKPSQSIPGISDGLYGDTVKPGTVSKAVKDSNTYYQNLSAPGIDKTKYAVVESTYNDQQDTKLDAAVNFPVVLIDGDASVLKQYLNAATNGGFDSMRACNKVAVTTKRYLYDQNSGVFREADQNNYPPTLVYHESTGEFTTTAQYDNQMDIFTLVTVTMTETATGGTFVLHIPVIVRRMLQVDFIATMTSGTVFNKTDEFYKDTKRHALAAQGGDITGYLSFYYNRNSSDTDNPASYDWQSYMEGGGDLLGYFKKTIDTGTSELPSGTKITLIDCQNGDKRYFSTVGENVKSDLELFNGGNLTFTASDSTSFTPATLSDLLQISTKDAENTDVKWVKLGTTLETAEKATVKATDGNYYRLYSAETDTGITELYTLTVGNLNPTENYFVVISVPNAENHRLTLDKSGMVWSKTTSSPPLEVHQVHRYDPTTIDPINGNSEASFNYLKNYTQDLTDNTSSANVPVQTSSAKVDIPIDITNTIKFTSTNYTDDDPLYQEFVISLKKTDNGSTTVVGIPSDAVAITGSDSDATTEQAVQLYAYYKDSSDNYHYYVWNGSSWTDTGANKTPATSYSWSAGADSTEMILPFAVKSESGYQYLDLAALRKASGSQFFLEVETTLEMSTASVMYNNTIPYDAANGGTIENFTQIDANSILSFTESGLSYSTLKGNVEGSRKYYLNTERRAILKLDYSDIDQLGINLLDHPAGQDAEIDTVLTLDFSNMEGFVSDVTQFKLLSRADTVEFTLILQKKGESEYSAVDMNAYIRKLKVSGEEKVTPSSTYTITLQKNADDTYPCYNEQSGQFTIPLSFFVKTDVNEFANYRVHASVKLLVNDIELPFDVNDTKAFVTYTYAKINTNGYWE